MRDLFLVASLSCLVCTCTVGSSMLPAAASTGAVAQPVAVCCIFGCCWLCAVWLYACQTAARHDHCATHAAWSGELQAFSAAAAGVTEVCSASQVDQGVWFLRARAAAAAAALRPTNSIIVVHQHIVWLPHAVACMRFWFQGLSLFGRMAIQHCYCSCPAVAAPCCLCLCTVFVFAKFARCSSGCAWLSQLPPAA